MVKPRHVPENDNVFRQCVFPVSFRGNKSRIFSYQKLLRLEESRGRLVTSVAWERYAPTTNHVHGYGCRLAEKRNTRLQPKDSYTKEKRSIYCGSYQLKLQNIRKLMRDQLLSEFKDSQIIHAVEDGEIAHANLEFFIDEKSQFDREGTKTAIIDLVWRAAQGPLLHVCEHEREATQPCHEDLPVPAAGPYKDDRTYLIRTWYLCRFYLAKLVLRLFPGIFGSSLG